MSVELVISQLRHFTYDCNNNNNNCNNLYSFRSDVLHSSLFSNSHSCVDGLFTNYNDVLRSLLDRHAPLRPVVVRSRQRSPWFDGQCRDMKRGTRRLERIYRVTHTSTTLENWRLQLDQQRSAFHARYVAYWKSAVADSKHDVKVLWSKLNVLLRPPAVTTASDHSVDDIAEFFIRKVDDIRRASHLSFQSI